MRTLLTLFLLGVSLNSYGQGIVCNESNAVNFPSFKKENPTIKKEPVLKEVDTPVLHGAQNIKTFCARSGGVNEVNKNVYSVVQTGEIPINNKFYKYLLNMTEGYGKIYYQNDKNEDKSVAVLCRITDDFMGRGYCTLAFGGVHLTRNQPTGYKRLSVNNISRKGSNICVRFDKSNSACTEADMITGQFLNNFISDLRKSKTLRVSYIDNNNAKIQKEIDLTPMAYGYELFLVMDTRLMMKLRD
ncbi:hypothetical protein [Providencia sp. PROV089]|uniref:hypothetical protein n=1 Tax=Providencia sp. PROV089 TaxID=2949805 RepID=UPI00234AEE2E|nr:hypothetical protein [Providencia sp. PROV089]